MLKVIGEDVNVASHTYCVAFHWMACNSAVLVSSHADSKVRGRICLQRTWFVFLSVWLCVARRDTARSQLKCRFDYMAWAMRISTLLCTALVHVVVGGGGYVRVWWADSGVEPHATTTS